MQGQGEDSRKELAKLNYEASIQESADRMRFQQEIGLTACKSVIAVNGGAIIGLLTFIGNHQSIANAADLKQSFYAFSIGIGCALISLIAGYLGQNWLADMRQMNAWNHQQEMRDKPGTHDVTKAQNMGWGLMVAASTFVMTGIGSFIGGAIIAADAIL